MELSSRHIIGWILNAVASFSSTEVKIRWQWWAVWPHQPVWINTPTTPGLPPPRMDKPSISHSAARISPPKICKFSASFLQKFFPPRAMLRCKHSYWHSGMRSESGVAGIRCESLLHFVSPMFLFEDDVCAPGFVTDKYRALTCHTCLPHFLLKVQFRIFILSMWRLFVV